jgi:hypothetical protein
MQSTLDTKFWQQKLNIKFKISNLLEPVPIYSTSKVQIAVIEHYKYIYVDTVLEESVKLLKYVL